MYVKYLSSARNRNSLAQLLKHDFLYKSQSISVYWLFRMSFDLFSSSFGPCSHQVDTFLELGLYLFFRSNNMMKSVVPCILYFLSELKIVCIMHWLTPPYWKCKLWWHLILRTYWMQETPWRKLKPPVKSKCGATQSINSPFTGKFWKT